MATAKKPSLTRRSIQELQAEAPPTTVQPTSAPPDDKVTRLTLSIPDSLMSGLKAKASADGVTVRVVVLQALRQAGFDVPEAELQDKRAVVGQLRRGVKA